MSTLDYARRKAFVNAIVSDTQITYREEEGARPHTKGNTIVMPQYDPTFTDAQDRVWMENLLTQAYSNMSENIQDVRQISHDSIDMASDYGYVYNTVCKHNHQQGREGILFGADEYIKEAQEHYLRGIDKEECSPKALALQALDVTSRLGWQLNTDYGIVSSLEGEAKDLYDKLVAVCLPEYSIRRPSGRPNKALADKIAKILEIENEDQSDGSGEGGEGEDESSEEEGEGSEGSKGKSKGEAGKGSEKTKTKGTIRPYVTEEDGDPNPPSIEGNDVEWDSSVLETGEHFVPLPTKLIIPQGTEFCPEFRQDVVRGMTSGLGAKVRNVLKVYSQAKYKGGQKRGKINKRAIASITTGNERIFRKKEVASVLDTAIMLLVDNSGSMSGGRHIAACAATAMTVETLNKLNVPVAVYGFTHTSRQNVMYQYSMFGEKTEVDKLLDKMSGLDINLAGNCDAESLMYAHDLLLRHKAKRRIMIVLSDGGPADGSNPTGSLRAVCKDIENNSPVELYSIGIQSTEVEEYYTNTRTIKRTDELEEALLGLLKEAMT